MRRPNRKRIQIDDRRITLTLIRPARYACRTHFSLMADDARCQEIVGCRTLCVRAGTQTGNVPLPWSAPKDAMASTNWESAGNGSPTIELPVTELLQ